MQQMSTTIFARASGRGKSGVSVFRISGPAASGALQKLLPGKPPPARRATLRSLHHPVRKSVIDDAIVIFFPAPNSFTGEDVAELHVHGSQAVEQALLIALEKMPGLRLAEPGEFARRAFENGRLDLAQIEGLADLIEAETEAQHRLALRTMQGEASQMVLDWRDQLLRCLARVEAAVDFSDEGEDTAGYKTAMGDTLAEIGAAIQKELQGSKASGYLRNGIEIAVIGPPNVGKSLLVNCIAGSELAISTAIAGTTRDVLEARLDIEGLPVTMLDTAGIRDPLDEIEAESIRRAKSRAELADLRVHVTASDVEAPSPRRSSLWRNGDIVVVNKSDILAGPQENDALLVSALTGSGVKDLVTQIGKKFAWVEGQASPAAAVLRRQSALSACAEELALADAGLAGEMSPEILAEHLRRALREIGKFVGSVDVEDVLDVIFAEFCLGK